MAITYKYTFSDDEIEVTVYANNVEEAKQKCIKLEKETFGEAISLSISKVEEVL